MRFLTFKFISTMILLLSTTQTIADCSNPDYWGRITFRQRDLFFQRQIRIISLKEEVKAQKLDFILLKMDLDSARRLHNYGYINLSELKAIQLEVDTLEFEIENNEFEIISAENDLETTGLAYEASCQELRDSSLDSFIISQISNLLSSWERQAILSPKRIDLKRRELSQAEEYLEWSETMYQREFITKRTLLEAEHDCKKFQNELNDLKKTDNIINNWVIELQTSIDLINSML